MAVVASTIRFIYRNHNQPSLCSLYVLCGAVLDVVPAGGTVLCFCCIINSFMCFYVLVSECIAYNLPSLIFGVMVPGDWLVFEDFRNFHKATQVNALTVCNYYFLLQYAGIANIAGLIGYVLWVG